jgi:membrane protease YdiL (CAAX protease family)
MNNILNKTIEFLKSFTGLIIYLSIEILFAFILNKQDIKSNLTLYVTTLCLSEIVLLLVLIFIFRKRIKKDFIDFDKNYKKYLSFGFKVWLIGLIIMTISNNIIYKFIDTAYNQQVNELVISKLPIYAVVGMIICGPFVEEITFRLSFKEHIKNKYIFIILTTIIFAGVHVLNGFNSPIQLLYFIPYGALSLAFAIILQKTNNIFTTVIIHTFHNSMAIVLLAIASIVGV